MASDSPSPSQTASDIVPPAASDQQHVQASPPAAADPLTATDSSLQQQAELPLVSPPQDGGSEVPADQVKKSTEVNRDDPNVKVVELPPHNPTFKEQVYGYARVIRGTVFGQPSVKEQGTEVLRGQKGIPLRQGSQSSK